MRNKLWVAVLALGLAGALPPVLRAADVTEAKQDQDEVKVKLEDCPQTVQDTLKKEAGSGTIKAIVKENENGKTIYSADVVIDGKTHEINVAEDGKLISNDIEKEKGDKDDKEETGEHKG